MWQMANMIKLGVENVGKFMDSQNHYLFAFTKMEHLRQDLLLYNAIIEVIFAYYSLVATRDPPLGLRILLIVLGLLIISRELFFEVREFLKMGIVKHIKQDKNWIDIVALGTYIFLLKMVIRCSYLLVNFDEPDRVLP